MAITTKREARKSVRQSGWITLDGGFAARPCTVLDLSSAGAKITVDDPQAVPAKVRLAFSRDARDRAHLPGGLAPGQNPGHQIRPVASARRPR